MDDIERRRAAILHIEDVGRCVRNDLFDGLHGDERNEETSMRTRTRTRRQDDKEMMRRQDDKEMTRRQDDKEMTRRQDDKEMTRRQDDKEMTRQGRGGGDNNNNDCGIHDQLFTTLAEGA